jgi:hypothetical protein
MRVDLILSDRKCYSYEAYAAERVVRYFIGAKIPHQLIYLSDGILVDYMNYIKTEPPSWTLSFSYLTPYQKPFCDVLNLPQFLWVSDMNIPLALHFIGSSFGRVGLRNWQLCQKLAAPNFFFLPQGVDSAKKVSSRQFDVVLFENLVSLNFLEQTWKEIFSEQAIEQIKRAICLGEPLEVKPYYFYVESYLNAQKVSVIVEKFKKVSTHIFGEHAGNNWLKFLPITTHLHAPLPYIEHFEVLKMSKIAIIEPTSEWYLPALAAGCLPLPPDEEQAHYYLSHSKEREALIEEIKHKIEIPTWEQQTEQLFKVMTQKSV